MPTNNRNFQRQLNQIENKVQASADPRKELRRELEKLRTVPPEEIARRYKAMLDEAAQTARSRPEIDFSTLTPEQQSRHLEDLSRRFRALIERS